MKVILDSFISTYTFELIIALLGILIALGITLALFVLRSISTNSEGMTLSIMGTRSILERELSHRFNLLMDAIEELNASREDNFKELSEAINSLSDVVSELNSKHLNTLTTVSNKLVEVNSTQLTSDDLKLVIQELSLKLEEIRKNLAANVNSVHQAVNNLDKTTAQSFLTMLKGGGK